MVEKKFRSWRIGTVNIRTGKEDIKLENVVHQINRARLAICGLQEVRRLGTDACVIESTTSDSTNKYEVHWSGHAVKNTPPSHPRNRTTIYPRKSRATQGNPGQPGEIRGNSGKPGETQGNPGKLGATQGILRSH